MSTKLLFRRFVLLLGSRVPLETPMPCAIAIIIQMALAWVVYRADLTRMGNHILVDALGESGLWWMSVTFLTLASLSSLAILARIAIICYPKEFDRYNTNP